MGGGYQAYLLRRALLPTCVLAYFLIASGAQAVRSTELFPFFNWSLFSDASNPKIDVILLVKSVDGASLDRPTQFYALGNRFSAAREQDTRLSKSLDRLTWSLQHRDAHQELRLRRLIEGTFLREAKTTDYDIALIVYDPIVRLRTGEIQSQRVLRSYRKGQ
jgi:hypothetical protein